MNMKRAKDIRIKKVMGNAQAPQHTGQDATAAERNHMHGARTYLDTLKGFGGEAPATMR
jgi:hypothetical protein